MGLFTKRTEPTTLLSPAELVPQRFTGEELERMVGETYEEKLKLQERVKQLEAKLEAQNETKAKLQAAELFASQTKDELEREKRMRERVEREREDWMAKARRAKDQQAACELRCEELQAAQGDLFAANADALVAQMLDALIYENGNWSKERVREFIASFPRDNAEIQGSGMDELRARIYETKHLHNVRLYVIGAVTGIENDNREAFEQVRTELERAGYKVEIPHDTIPAGTPWKQAMHQSIRRLLESDGVAVLDGFANSAGASIEYALCCDLKHPIGNWRRWVEDATRHISYTVPESWVKANPMLGIVTEAKPTANQTESKK